MTIYNYSRLSDSELQKEINLLTTKLIFVPEADQEQASELKAILRAATGERDMRAARKATPVTGTEKAELLKSANRTGVVLTPSAVTNSPEALTTERGKTHGDWNEQARLANELKTAVRGSMNWETMAPFRVEAIDMILTKISRICTGNEQEPDHWDDISGYAFLGKGGHK